MCEDDTDENGWFCFQEDDSNTDPNMDVDPVDTPQTPGNPDQDSTGDHQGRGNHDKNGDNDMDNMKDGGS